MQRRPAHDDRPDTSPTAEGPAFGPRAQHILVPPRRLMFVKVFNLKFANITDAKIAAAYISEQMAICIEAYDMHSMTVLMCKDGNVSVTAKFDTNTDLQHFIREKCGFIDDLRHSLLFKMDHYSAVAVFNFERDEARGGTRH
jgi:hypothetical protein